MPEPLKLEIVPPTATTSAAVKDVDDSLSVKVMVAVSPALRAGVLLVMEIVGATVSTVSVGESWPATLALPAGSVNVPAGTEIEPGVVELAVGVKVAV